MPSNRQLNTLVGNEGQVGQGIKAISRVLGHLHESTTLKHYVHILFTATYAYSTATTTAIYILHFLSES